MNEQSMSKEHTGPTEHLSKSAVWMFGAIVLGRILGFARESSLAFVFGVKPEVDAFIVAQTVTFLLFSFLGPAIWNAGIPVLSEVYAKDATGRRQHYRKIVWSFFHLIVIVTGIFMLIGYFVTPFLIHVVAPGFDPLREEVAIRLTRAMLPVLLFYGLSGWASLVLQTQNRFGSTAVSYLPNNMIAIFGIFLSSFTGSIEMVAVSFMLGIAGQVLVQVPGVMKTKYKLSLGLRNAEFIKIMKLAPSTLVSELGTQINTVVDRIFGSGLMAGSIATLGYGQRAFNMVTGVIQMPIIIVLFPKLSALNGLGEDEGFFKLLGKGLSMLNFLMIPAAVGLMTLSVPVTQLLFERGAFIPSSTLITASIVFYYTIGLPFLSLRDLLIRALYARKDSKTPMVNTIIMVASNAGLNFFLVPIFGVKALAMGTTFGAIVSTFICYLIIRHKYRKHLVHMKGFYQSLWKSLSSSAGMVAVIYIIAERLGVNIAARSEMSQLALIASLTVVIVIAAIAYILFTMALKSKENKHCMNIMLGLLGKNFAKLKANKAQEPIYNFRGEWKENER